MKVTIDFYDGGYCTHPEFVAIKGGSFKSVKFPAMCAIITHPTLGPILYDTGYSEHFFEATKKMPYAIYAKVTPIFVNQEDKIFEKLKSKTDFKNGIQNIILSHFHADHVGGVIDFKNAQYIYTQDSYSHLKGMKGVNALRNGFLPSLLPEDFESRSKLITKKNIIRDHFLCTYFTKVYDIFGDRSLIGVELPGHARGQLGIYLETKEKNFFLIADACFLSRTFKDIKMPSKIVDFINDNPIQYRDTISRIHHLYSENEDIEIIPSHCGDTFKKYVKECLWDLKDINTCLR